MGHFSFLEEKLLCGKVILPSQSIRASPRHRANPFYTPFHPSNHFQRCTCSDAFFSGLVQKFFFNQKLGRIRQVSPSSLLLRIFFRKKNNTCPHTHCGRTHTHVQKTWITFRRVEKSWKAIECSRRRWRRFQELEDYWNAKMMSKIVN